MFSHFEILRLTAPIHQHDDLDFSAFLDSIGDNIGHPDVDLGCLQHTHSPDKCINFIFPSNVLANPVECARRAILSPFNEFVDEFNSGIIDRLQGDSHQYLSTDSIEDDDSINSVEGPLSDPDVLNSLTEPGMPDHILTLKVGALCRLTRNFDPSRGLTKNTHVIVRHMYNHSVEVETIPSVVAGEAIASVRVQCPTSISQTLNCVLLYFRKLSLCPALTAIFSPRISIS